MSTSVSDTVVELLATHTANGRFGVYGGQYVPETLMANLIALEAAFNDAMADAAFNSEYERLLADFVGRPTPLYYAERLSKAYGGNIFLKREDVCHTGAHKINNAVGQVLLARRMGKRRIVAETGAGQHGVATASTCARFGMECVVYMGALDCERQRHNVERMELLGGRVIPCESGSRTLKVAINEALRDWIANPDDTHYLIGSVVGPHPYPAIVRYFQSVIGIEAREQYSQTQGDLPDAVIACVGGGSNAIGVFSAFLDNDVELVGVEAAGKRDGGHHAAPLIHGKPGVLHGALTYVLQNEDGQIQSTRSIAPGLDYPGVGPEHSSLKDAERVRYVKVHDDEVLAAFTDLSRLEGILPALESCHAVAYAKQLLRDRPGLSVIVNLSGRGDKDLATVTKELKP
ncbi:MAG: tryptophan synthase subunit beta [Planctomycetes bacterium]|nr:tryptophan synthase subunit beta [Planctomycetota bacterium]